MQPSTNFFNGNLRFFRKTPGTAVYLYADHNYASTSYITVRWGSQPQINYVSRVIVTIFKYPESEAVLLIIIII